MQRIVSASMSPHYRLHLDFADGAAGVVELGSLVARGGVYAAIAASPASLRIGEKGRSVEWLDGDGETVDFCADALREAIDQAQAAAQPA